MELEPLDPALAREILGAEGTGILVIEAPGRIVWANSGYFDVTGRDERLLGQDLAEVVEEDGSLSREIREAVDAALERGASTAFRAVRARYRQRPGGLYLDVDVRPLAGRLGGPAHAWLLIRDVSARFEDEVRARLFYEAFRSSTNAMQLTDSRGVMVDVNPAFERIYGYTRAECVGRKPNLVRSKHTPLERYQGMWRDLVDPLRGYWSGEITNRDRQGRERPILLSITAIRNPAGAITHYLGVAVDLSEQRSWERRLEHSDRLESLGQLAAGVAHEINTPLANVMLIAESLRRRSDDPDVLARLDRMTGQIDVAARIVRGLLDFARREEPQATDLDLVAVARLSVEFLRGKQSADVRIDELYPREPVHVAGDRGQLTQVITNILNNAYDALEGKGSLQISVRPNGRRAEIEVLDHGPGIPEELLPRVFEPFFTTKPEGHGTGLGLAICSGIVSSHHGTITARNVPGAGAAILISLPLRSGPASPA